MSCGDAPTKAPPQKCTTARGSAAGSGGERTQVPSSSRHPRASDGAVASAAEESNDSRRSKGDDALEAAVAVPEAAAASEVVTSPRRRDRAVKRRVPPFAVDPARARRAWAARACATGRPADARHAVDMSNCVDARRVVSCATSTSALLLGRADCASGDLFCQL